MVMTAPLRMVIGEVNDRTTKGACQERLALRAVGSGGAWLSSRVVTASLSLLIARHGWVAGVREAVLLSRR
jgi:hypothetical protein